MTDHRCPQTDLLQSMCAHCRGHAALPKLKLSTGEFGVPFLARYEGRCGICDEPIHIGDVTARLAAEVGDGYGCQECLP